MARKIKQKKAAQSRKLKDYCPADKRTNNEPPADWLKVDTGLTKTQKKREIIKKILKLK